MSGVRVATCLGEEGVEGVVAGADGLVGGHLAVRLDAMKILKKNCLRSSNLDAMLEAIKFPARVPDLATGLTDVDGDALTLVKKELYCIQSKKILKLCKMSSF